MHRLREDNVESSRLTTTLKDSFSSHTWERNINRKPVIILLSRKPKGVLNSKMCMPGFS